MHFRILKMIAASSFLTASECTKFVFGRTLLGSLPRSTKPPSWFKGDPTSVGNKRGGRKRGLSLTQILASASDDSTLAAGEVSAVYWQVKVKVNGV